MHSTVCCNIDHPIIIIIIIITNNNNNNNNIIIIIIIIQFIEKYWTRKQ